MGNYTQGRFRPSNPSKYKGNATDIIYRSSWELKMLMDLDRDPNVIEYSSEEVVVRYRSPLDNKVHRYFVDFYVKKKEGDEIKEYLYEVKPHAETLPPKVGKQKKKTLFNQQVTYVKNQAKWQAAEAYAAARGWHFVVLTEHSLGIATRGK